ncbi:hypothetical protein N7491_011151 [Penicillium cf. griseofulvum]|uniref:Uncharacterized protein n=1 Tax=Penicillium cf. griseofulvum TaxID=2972120 RepID=A0A9W9N174_9EURO|nr:hypothetical protein N7472_001470 [Penicillium cf. griseofulvum]KAJ5422706.1 hypothetical protein N7491_011151 [Penicillium cf. griseofulvum]KAJ5428882.1 hypothetical protein N7445_010336 [Penicillium cf. griseofulvum]
MSGSEASVISLASDVIAAILGIYDASWDIGSKWPELAVPNACYMFRIFKGTNRKARDEYLGTNSLWKRFSEAVKIAGLRNRFGPMYRLQY